MFEKRSIMRILTIAFLVSAIALSATGVSDRVIGACGVSSLSKSNDVFLKRTFDRALNGFMVLSGIKMVVSVIEGSEVGVGFSLEVGDVAQPAYDYVDIAWRTLLTGSVVLLMTKHLLEMADVLDHWSLALALALILLMVILKWYVPNRERIHGIVKACALFATVLTIALYVILPIAVAGGAFLSDTITRPSIEDAENQLENVRTKLFSSESNPPSPLSSYGEQHYSEEKDVFHLPLVSKKIGNGSSGSSSYEEKNETSADIRKEMLPKELSVNSGFFSKMKGFKDRIEIISEYLTKKTRDIVVWIIRLIAGYIFDCIVFPYLLFIILFWFTKTAAVYLFEFNRRSELRRDLNELAKKLYTPSGGTGRH